MWIVSLILAFQGSAELPKSSAPPPPAIQAMAEALAKSPPEKVNAYRGVVEELSAADRFQLHRAINLLNLRSIGVAPMQAYSACLDTKWFWQVNPGLTFAEAATSDEAWRRQLLEVDDASQNLIKERNAASAGAAINRSFAAAASLSLQAKSASEPRGRAYLERAARDQLARASESFIRRGVGWSSELSSPTRAYLNDKLNEEACDIDLANAQWLREDISSNGWPTISKYGSQVDTAAWLLVQHADHDRALQKIALANLESLANAGETNPRNYAYLFDRIATAEQRPQRYGTQGRCAASGNWEPFEIENPQELDKRRTSVGLAPMNDYLKSAPRCGVAIKPSLAQ